MAKKVLGYLLTLAGLFLISLTIEAVSKIIPLKLPAEMTNLYLIISGGILILLGIMLLKTPKGILKDMKGMEVPIYHGKNIVGYRRN